MGSGAGAASKNSQNKNNLIEVRYGIKPEKIIERDGVYYCDLERDEFKLSNYVLLQMEKYNSFSRDLDDVSSSKQKSAKIMGKKN